MFFAMAAPPSSKSPWPSASTSGDLRFYRDLESECSNGVCYDICFDNDSFVTGHVLPRNKEAVERACKGLAFGHAANAGSSWPGWHVLLLAAVLLLVICKLLFDIQALQDKMSRLASLASACAGNEDPAPLLDRSPSIMDFLAYIQTSICQLFADTLGRFWR